MLSAGARSVLRDTRNARGKDLLSDLAAEELRKEIERYCGLGDRVIDQARRRVLGGEQVPNADDDCILADDAVVSQTQSCLILLS
jgi:hypothetical protein